MKDNCFDEGTIQAFIDGELSADLLENVARHIASCDDCSLLLQAAEDESAFTFATLDEEFNALVPTERIRANVYQAIAEIKETKVSWWQKIFAGISLSNPSMVAFASLLIVAGLFASVWIARKQEPTPTNEVVAKTETPQNTSPKIQPIPSKTIEDIAQTRIESEEKIVSKSKDSRFKVQDSKFKVQDSRFKIQNSGFRIQDSGLNKKMPVKSNSAPTVEAELMDGEVTYLKTIATLENTVKDKKDNVLRASSRISFERDMAVVDDSIKKMKNEVRKNPKNEAAKQILKNSYQNKIDLLNSVTEKSEFMASLD